MADVVHSSRFEDLDVQTFHDLLKLRIDVFVVEQAAPYSELDGRDCDAGTVHWWVERDGRVASALRVLEEADGAVSIGRVVTNSEHRGQGLSAALLQTALDSVEGPALLNAQAHLEDWYSGFGFVRAGPGFIEDGIPHVPMRRPADP